MPALPGRITRRRRSVDLREKPVSPIDVLTIIKQLAEADPVWAGSPSVPVRAAASGEIACVNDDGVDPGRQAGRLAYLNLPRSA
jgi:hypothetical protein